MKGILGTIMYGPAATSGVLYIKTRLGTKNERLLHIDIENGVSVVDRMPGYVSGADYARLQNQARVNDGLPEICSSTAIAGYARTMIDLHPVLLFRSSSESEPFIVGGNDIVSIIRLGYAGGVILLIWVQNLIITG
jgi:hypothetical protein